MRTVTWVKGTQNEWLDFLACSLSNVHAFGVYIIWHAGPSPWTVYIGHGNIKDRLLMHSLDSRILAHLSKGLLVTWAAVASSEAEGVARFLTDRLRPLIEEKRRDVRPISVNLPGAA